ncbi:hypothetical protein F4678DRAFT_108828 [Xylaria arbuscula]|nr:hypothetical protein F4678DRAFT_108828 [Xylaria arbuscula]
MALRLSIRLSAGHIHSINRAAKVRCPQRQIAAIPSRFFSAAAVSHPSNSVQVYISRSTDPYLNLSIEHFLLQKSHPDSVVLLLYTNRPCIVIGRNQNPWVEVNLGLVNQRGILRRLRRESGSTTAGNGSTVVRDVDREGPSRVKGEVDTIDDGDDDVFLVRRRSGGGTVFHDAGNVNYSVICPPASFDRNKHAEMVVRALQGLKKIPHGVRVNERHDIVLDISPTSNEQHALSAGVHGNAIKTFKISGSAYKLTRQRSLHHGTCLLSSPHLLFLSQLLRSPAAPYIKARGVESVRSPVRNVGVSNAEFEDAVVAEFLRMYNNTNTNTNTNTTPNTQTQTQKSKISVEILDAADVKDIPEIQAGVAELQSRDWIYAQTPQFTFSSRPTADDPRPRPDLPTDLPPSFFPASSSHDSKSPAAAAADANAPGLQMTVRHAEITDVAAPGTGLGAALKGLHVHHIDDWRTRVGNENESLGRWLNGLFGVRG